MEHYIGGYFLVEGCIHPPWASLPQLPRRFWSISDCIASVHPHTGLLAWTDTDRRAGHLGWPSAWLDPAPTQAFYAAHLRHLHHLKLLGIALPETYYNEALQAFAPAATNEGAASDSPPAWRCGATKS